MKIDEILEYLPHRYPFLMVDTVISVEPGVSIVATKNVTINEPFFQGHFPGIPVMPGVLIIEALAQASGILIHRTLGRGPDKQNWFFLAGVKNAKFKRIVKPGDKLLLEVLLERRKKDFWKFNCTAKVEDELACSVTILNAKGAV